MMGPTHLMLTGISQTVFLRQWGMPEIKISLDHLEACFILDFITLNIDSIQKGFVTVWIYEKKDRVVFFRGEKLISHFKWTQFKKRFKRLSSLDQDMPCKEHGSVSPEVVESSISQKQMQE